MNTNEAKILAAQIAENISQIDLHGLYPLAAKEKLEHFLFVSYQQKITMMRVVYGLGTGKLCEEILAYLKNHPLVELCVESSGSCVVILKY